MVRMTSASVREQVISLTQHLIRERGFNGFSYRDLADKIGVKTASIHYYFPTKNDLLLAAVENYKSMLATSMQSIDRSLSAKEQLDAYHVLLRRKPSEQICMCGMLAADFSSIPNDVRTSIRGFYRTHETFLSEVLALGAKDGTLKCMGDPETAGRWLFAAFQGSLLSSRLFEAPSRIADVVASVQAPVTQAA
jgi:TetR/AcrR family transcriptional repressor of nem operon